MTDEWVKGWSSDFAPRNTFWVTTQEGYDDPDCYSEWKIEPVKNAPDLEAVYRIIDDCQSDIDRMQSECAEDEDCIAAKVLEDHRRARLAPGECANYHCARMWMCQDLGTTIHYARYRIAKELGTVILESEWNYEWNKATGERRPLVRD